MNIVMSIILLPFLAISLTVHEFAHAWTASLLGDEFARRNGRVSLNPARHMSVIGTLAILLLPFGWAKPVIVNPYNFRRPRRDFLITSLAGPAANLLMVGLCLALGQLTRHSYALGSHGAPFVNLAHLGLLLLVMVNTALCVINLVPIPPLDGSRIWPMLFPKFSLALRGKGNLLCLIAVFVLFSSHALNQVIDKSQAFTQRFFPVSDESLAMGHVALANKAFDRKDYSAAMAEFDQALAVDQRVSDAHYGQAMVLNEKKSLDESLAAINRAIELSPRRALYYSLRSKIYASMGRQAEASQDAQRAVELSHKITPVHQSEEPDSMPATQPETRPSTGSLSRLLRP